MFTERYFCSSDMERLRTDDAKCSRVFLIEHTLRRRTNSSPLSDCGNQKWVVDVLATCVTIDCHFLFGHAGLFHHLSPFCHFFGSLLQFWPCRSVGAGYFGQDKALRFCCQYFYLLFIDLQMLALFLRFCCWQKCLLDACSRSFVISSRWCTSPLVLFSLWNMGLWSLY